MLEIKRDRMLLAYTVYVDGRYVGRFWKTRGNVMWCFMPVGVFYLSMTSTMRSCLSQILEGV